MSVLRSVVKWFDAKKGYGFIVHPKGGNDIFIHYSQIHSDKDFKTLQTGEVVEFELHDGPKGPHAKETRVIDTESDGDDAQSQKASPSHVPSSDDLPAEHDGEASVEPSRPPSPDGAPPSPEPAEMPAAEMPDRNAPNA